MSDQKSKKVFGRGRGKPSSRPEGPWARSKKLDESHVVRPPRKDGEDFVLTENSFPPLPGAISTDQFVDSNEDKPTPHLNGTVLPGKMEKESNEKSETSEDKSDNDHKEEEEKKLIKRQESDHYRDLRLQDQKAQKPSEIIYTKSGERLLLKPSGRKFYINADGTLGKQKFMLDDLKRAFLYTQEHLAKMQSEREQRKRVLLRQLETRLRLEDPNYRPEPPKVDITNSNLSPLAPEFVPKFANMNPEARDFVPTTTRCDEANNNRTIMSNFNVNDTAAILADLEETVSFCYSKLMETPASYDELMGVVTPHFIKYMENPDLPNEIVQALYTYAVQDMRFAYFAVKILIHLIEMTGTEDNKQLRDILLRHAQEEVASTQNFRLTNPTTNCTTDIQPILMFLSELYIQLEVGGRRLSPVGAALVETLTKLLSSENIVLKDRLKLIVNILKLTGLSLDNDNPMILDSLFNELAMIVKEQSSNLESSTIQIVNDIILLRNLNWGLVEPDLEEYLPDNSELPLTPNGNHVFAHCNDYEPEYDDNMGYSSGVFYGPDGHPIDYEEQLFLEVETNALNHLTVADQGEPSPTSVEGYDEAYEEFLKTVPGHSSH